MSITIKPIEDMPKAMSETIKPIEDMPKAMSGSDFNKALETITASLTTSVLETVRKEISESTQLAIKTGLSYVKIQADEIQAKIDAIQVPKAQVMAVQINDAPMRSLSKTASPVLGRLIINAKLGLNTMLVGPAGCGKSTACEQLAESLGVHFTAISLTAGASETWITGRQKANGVTEASFSKALKSPGVVLIDEIDAADANLLILINELTESGYFTNSATEERFKKHEQCILVACANTVGKGGDMVYTGRNRLDAATLNRFNIVFLDYNEEIELLACPDNEIRETLLKARQVIKDKRGSEVISTRTLVTAYKLSTAGIAWNDIVESITAGWSKDLINACKLTEVKRKRGRPEKQDAIYELDETMSF